jgi:hypothetical protein
MVDRDDLDARNRLLKAAHVLPGDIHDLLVEGG